VQELVEGKPYLAVSVLPLLETRNGIVQQIADLDRKVLILAPNDQASALVHDGAGPSHRALLPSNYRRTIAFQAIAECRRLCGATNQALASGEIDWTGRISKCGDAMLRSYLFEAAGVLLTRVQK
jgi:transposase